MEEQAEGATRTIQMRRVLLDVGPPSIAHHVGWIRAGNEVLLEIGYLDHRAIHEHMRTVAENASPIEIEWFVTNRFIFTSDHAARLSKVFGELAEQLKANIRTEEQGGFDAAK